MSSAEYQTLLQSVADLQSALLNFDPRTVEPYTNEELLKCQGFVVFSHAEIQAYWESVSRRILREAEKRWNNNSGIDRVLATLVAFRRLDKPGHIWDFERIISDAIITQKDVIDKNNGIKRTNVANLLYPLGIFKSDLTETFLIQLDQTGKKRGDMVHKSSRVSLRNIRDPFAEERKDIDNLISEIGIFDEKLETLGLLSIPLAPVAAVISQLTA